VGRQIEENFRWENLSGKIIIDFEPGDMPDIILKYILKQNGLVSGKDVQIVRNMGIKETVRDLQDGIVDYVVLLEPAASLVELEGNGSVIASLGNSYREIPHTVYMTTKSLVRDKPELIQKFTNAIYKGQVWVATHSAVEVAYAIEEFFPDIDRELLVKVVERYKSLNMWDVNPLIEDAAFNYLQDMLQISGELEIKCDPAVLISQDFAKNTINTVTFNDDI